MDGSSARGCITVWRLIRDGRRCVAGMERWRTRQCGESMIKLSLERHFGHPRCRATSVHFEIDDEGLRRRRVKRKRPATFRMTDTLSRATNHSALGALYGASSHDSSFLTRTQKTTVM